MRHSIARNTFLFSVLIAYMEGLPVLAAQTQNGPAQVPTAATSMPAPTQPVSLCANRPLCYEANDFVATVTEFRTSTDAYHGVKVIDAMVHFQNKTNQPISLGYVDGSGSALDDMGNRLGLNTYGGGVRGMGVMAGNQMDPKFTLAPGGGGDARFEMWWAPRGQLSGVNYEMEFSIREMNRVEGNQWTLGAEDLIHYQGLANGMGVAPITSGNSFASGSGAMSTGGAASPAGSALGALVPGQNSASTAPVNYVAAGQPCPPGTSAAARIPNVASAAGQNQNASNAVANASAAISSLGSLFGKKKPQPATAANSAGVTPCVGTAINTPGPATNAAASAPVSQTAGATASHNASGSMQTAATPATTQRTTAATGATTVNTQQSPRVLTNTSLQQPASTSKASKPSPAKPAATKPGSTAATTNTQEH